MAASLCAHIAQSNKHTFVELINALKEWDWKKNYQRRHDNFDLKSDGPCSWQHHILVSEFACFALSLVNREIYNIAVRGISCRPHFYTIFCGLSWQISAKQPTFKCYHSLDGNFFLWGIAAVSILNIEVRAGRHLYSLWKFSSPHAGSSL